MKQILFVLISFAIVLATGCSDHRAESAQDVKAFCKQHSDGSYREAFRKATANKELWELAGDKSAEVYAERARLGAMSICSQLKSL